MAIGQMYEIFNKQDIKNEPGWVVHLLNFVSLPLFSILVGENGKLYEKIHAHIFRREYGTPLRKPSNGG